MTMHQLMDGCLWIIAVLWLCQFLARHPGPVKRNRKLPAPSINCERTGDWRVNLPGMARRQGD